MKALVLGGVPENLTKTLPAGEWVKAALAPLGGKCGPKTFCCITGGIKCR